ncbi:hypothetical protein lpa_01489 [Legionella pneumophila 2300/99 Alcoy]|nr:hypothetical protein lpa_01489 [Legionella pneumophila 2300/99 Alcoy]
MGYAKQKSPMIRLICLIFKDDMLEAFLGRKAVKHLLKGIPTKRFTIELGKKMAYYKT